MIIDFHTHVFSPEIIAKRSEYLKHEPVLSELYSDPKAKMTDAEDLLKALSEQQVDYAVMQNLQWRQPDICHISNEYIAAAILSHPDKLGGFGMVSFENPRQAVREIEWCAAHGLKGIGEIRPAATLLRDIEGLRPVIEALIETDLILSTHCSEPAGHLYPGKGDLTPEVLYPLIKAFPDLKLVCAHWGGGLPFYALMPEVKKALQNVYFDSAASPYLYSPQIYQRTAELCGEEHILFGSDYPLLKPQRLLREIDQLDLTGEYRQRLLSANAATLLKLPQA